MMRTTKVLRRAAYAALALLALASVGCSELLATPAPLPTPLVPPTIIVTSAPVAPLPTSAPELLAPTSAPLSLDMQTEESALVDLYKRVNPAVAFILVTSNLGESLGSGFVIDGEGDVVTNAHVVENAQQIEVDFPSGVKVYGKVLGSDADADLAVIKVDVPADQLTVVELGDSDAVQVGQRVVAIGNPFGLAGTMTVGIVSGLGRTLTSQRTTGEGRFSAPDVIQTDAAINPGNSGGPLLDLQGRVIGVNRAITSETGVNSGVGFAVAVNLVKRIVPHLIAEGKFIYPYLGISSVDGISLAQQEALGLSQSAGVYLSGVTPDSPAEAAGLRPGTRATTFEGLLAGGDLITAIDGHPVANFNDLISYLVNHTEVGQTVNLTVLRDDQTIEVPLVLGARP
jgi:S1-C subfamily serine protease